jgi:hypothetical protein
VIKATRKKLGWVKSGPKYCQVVREANRIARLGFCQQLKAKNETFEDVIFTDELYGLNNMENFASGKNICLLN